MTRCFPLRRGFIVTSPFGPRDGVLHAGTDFGWPGGSAGLPVHAVQDGTVIYAGAAQGYGGPDPAGWLVIDSDDAQGGGCVEYGHIVREVGVGARVKAGQRIGRINPDVRTNGGVAPHLHLSVMPREYNPAAKLDPIPWLGAARYPDAKETAMAGYGITKVMHGYNPGTVGTGNSDGPRQQTSYVVVHTQEARATAVDLANFCNSREVSYNFAVDDEDTVEIVPVDEAPWAAMEANSVGVHLCFAGSFAGWSRGKWLERDSSDGLDEDAMLTRGARVVAAACAQYGIPVIYAGDGGHAGWPVLHKGIVGHRDFGQRGGGHSDPGDGFPMDEFLARVNGFLHGTTTIEEDDMALSADDIEKISDRVVEKILATRLTRLDGTLGDTIGNVLSWMDKHDGDVVDALYGKGARDKRDKLAK